MERIYIKSKDEQINENSQLQSQQSLSDSAMANGLQKAMPLATLSVKEVGSTKNKIQENILASVGTKTTCSFKELIL